MSNDRRSAAGSNVIVALRDMLYKEYTTLRSKLCLRLTEKCRKRKTK